MTLHNPEKYINLLRDKYPQTYQENRTEHPVHQAYALINADVVHDNVRWNKCLDCGQPYIIGEGEGNSTFCSKACEDDTIEYMNDPRNTNL